MGKQREQFEAWADKEGLSDSEIGVAEVAWRASWQAALAARQPVGPGPVGVSVTPEMRAAFRRAYREGGFWADRLDTALDAMMRAAPTAQAVDLGQFRALAEFGEEFAIGVGCAPHSYEVHEQALRLLELIDSQA